MVAWRNCAHASDPGLRLADLCYDACCLVAENQRPVLTPVAIDDVQIRVADTDGSDVDCDLARTRRRDFDLLESQRPVPEDCGPRSGRHPVCHGSRSSSVTDETTAPRASCSSLRIRATFSAPRFNDLLKIR